VMKYSHVLALSVSACMTFHPASSLCYYVITRRTYVRTDRQTDNDRPSVSSSVAVRQA